MPDTQLARYQVFLQEKEGAPYQDAGSIHASDPELALMNARDVFVRRPDCTGLWVAPAEAVFSRTAEELSSQPLTIPQLGVESQLYHVFTKAKSTGTQVWIGSFEAGSPEEALLAGMHKQRGQKPPFAWWVVPDRAITRSDPADSQSFFSPALDKPFRLSTDFHTVSAMRQLRRKREAPADSERETTAGRSRK